MDRQKEPNIEIQGVEIDTPLPYMSVPFIDMHTHIKDVEKLALWQDYFSQNPDSRYFAVVCSTCPQEAAWLFPAIENDPVLRRHLFPIAALHPWKCNLGLTALADLLPYMQRSPIIGEVGLDRVWCDVDYSTQKAVLLLQLDIASGLGKPVVLHSKGYERELCDLIKDYSYPKIIHWYSLDDRKLLQAYINQGCYFTLGSDNMRNPDCVDVWKHVPLSRLLVETDGYEAIRWADEEWPEESETGAVEIRGAVPIRDHQSLEVSTVTASIARRIAFYADLHGLEVGFVRQQLYENSQKLLGLSI